MTTKSGREKARASSRDGRSSLKRAVKAKAKAKPKPAPKPHGKKAVRAPGKAAPKRPGVAAGAPKVPGSKAAAARPEIPKAAPARVPPAAKKPPAGKKKPSRRREFVAYRRTLVERQRELVQAYSRSKGDTRAHPDSGTEDYIDYAVSSYTKEFVLSLTEMDRKQLLMVEEALARIDHGEYGRCLQCGEEIADRRLEVAPWVRYCIRCQDLEEQGLLPEYPSRLGADETEEEEGEEIPAPDYDADLASEDAEDLEEGPLGVDEDDAEESEEN